MLSYEIVLKKFQRYGLSEFDIYSELGVKDEYDEKDVEVALNRCEE